MYCKPTHMFLVVLLVLPHLANADSSGDLGDIYPWHVPIKVHVVHDGSGGITPQEVAEGLAKANQVLIVTDLRVFQIDSVDYITSPEYATLNKFCYDGSDSDGTLCCDADDDSAGCVGEFNCPNNGTCDFIRKCEVFGNPCFDSDDCLVGMRCLGENDRLRLINNDPDALDLYYVELLDGSNGQCSRPSDIPGVLIEQGKRLTSTTAHEIGHYFDLSHTHAGEIECPDGGNPQDGDGIEDTPADPNLSRHVTENECSDNGDPCDEDSDCASNDCIIQACTWDQLTCAPCPDEDCPDQGKPCWWTCADGAKAGQDCNGDEDCYAIGTCNGSTCEDVAVGQSCMVDADCEDSGTCDGDSDLCPGLCTTDATGPQTCEDTSVPYTPDARNLMSYAPKPCRSNVTAGQNQRMLDTWECDRPNLYNRTRYVNTDGADGSGTPQDPDGSFADAVDDAFDGDHLFLDSLVFSETPMVITKQLILNVWDPSDGPAVIAP